MDGIMNIYTIRNILSHRLVLSYSLDWLSIIVIGVVGNIWSNTTPTHRPFSLTDPKISYPRAKHETVPFEVALVLALVVPAFIMVLVVSIRIPGSTVDRNTPRSVVWRYKIWECNAAWLGLALAFAASYTTAKGLKLLYGKPRPDLLARCKPDVSNIAAYAVGGMGLELPGAPILVSLEICQNMSKSLTVTGFTSFPSDHSSLSFAGLTYLSLWLCSKYSIAFPYLAANRANHRPHDEEQATVTEDSAYHLPPSVREEGAAPPIYMLIIVAIPIAVACFISASRWFDNRHNGVDILSGSALGVFCAWFGFRLYNLPIQRGAGWSWGPRSRNHAFLKGVGFPSHVGNDNWASGMESGRVALD